MELITGPSVNAEMLQYDFSEDGFAVAEGLHHGKSQSLAATGDGEERPVLAELEGIVMKTPTGSPKKVVDPPTTQSSKC